MTATIPEAAKTIIEGAIPAQANRPVQVVIDVLFHEGSRKVTPSDLEAAASAAAAAFRASLESRKPTYSISSIKGTVQYVYIQARRAFTA